MIGGRIDVLWRREGGRVSLLRKKICGNIISFLLYIKGIYNTYRVKNECSRTTNSLPVKYDPLPIYCPP